MGSGNNVGRKASRMEGWKYVHMCTLNMNIRKLRKVCRPSPVPVSSTHQSKLEHLGEFPVYALCVWSVQPCVWDVVHGLPEIMHDLLRGTSLALGGEGREGGARRKGGEGGDGEERREEMRGRGKVGRGGPVTIGLNTVH